MFRRSYFSFVFGGLAVLLAVNIASFSQTGAPVSGRVEMQKADGTHEPVAGALIEAYRTDVKGSLPSSKTNKKGEFNFVSFPFGAEFGLIVSCATCAPIAFPNVKAGAERLVITVSPGDGKHWTEAEARANLTSAPGPSTGDSGGETQAEKNARAEIEKKNAEILAKNEKIKAGDAAAAKANTEGYEALKANNYDLALAKFNEGIEAVPDYVGSTPVMLNGKMDALRRKGFALYQEGFKTTDAAARKSKLDEAIKNYDDALASFQQAETILKSAPAATDPTDIKRRETINLSLYRSAMELHRLRAGIDAAKVTEANTLIGEYLTLETDPAKKIEAGMNLGDIMRRTGDFEKAIAAYRQVLALNPDNAEANGQLGLSLFGQAVAMTPENKEMEQEGMNYMQKYIDMAPVSDTDTPSVKELKNSIKDALVYLKNEKMAPQKVTAAPKAAPRKKN